MTGEILRILVAVEENVEGSVALPYAANLAHILKADLRVIHVIEEACIYAGWGALVAWTKEEIEKQKRRVDAEVEKYRKELKLEAGTKITEGLYPACEIVMEFHAGDYDLLIIGSRGISAVAEILLGGISSQVVHHAKKPVIVVKSPREISKILMCTAGSECSLDAIRYAAPIAGAAKAHVSVLSVSELDTTESVNRAWQFARAGVEILKEHGVGAEALVRVGKPAEEILAEARIRDFDLIVMGHVGRSAVSDVLLGEVASRVMHRLPRPILVFREWDERGGASRKGS